MSLAHLFDQPVVKPKNARLVALEGTGSAAVADRSRGEKLRIARERREKGAAAAKRYRDRKAQKA